MSPRGSKYVHGFFSEYGKQESIRIEDTDPEGARINNQAPEVAIYTTVVIKWSDATKGPRVKVDGPLCGGLYKEDHGSIIPWSGTYPDVKMNYFTCSTNENDWIILGDQYNEEFNNWIGPIYNGQFRQHNFKEMRKTEETCSKYTGSVKFNGIPRERKPAIPIN